jgi:hypothetical protein
MSIMGRFSRRPADARPTAAPGTILEAAVGFEMVDFYKEHQQLIRLGFARSPRDVETTKVYRITTRGSGVLTSDNGLVVRGARVICDGKLMGLGCSGVVPVVHGLLPSSDGHLRLQLKGVLDALSKWTVSCTCGTQFLVYADATVGSADEAYLVVVTTQQPSEARLAITPFFETDGVDVVAGPLG